MSPFLPVHKFGDKSTNYEFMVIGVLLLPLLLLRLRYLLLIFGQFDPLICICGPFINSEYFCILIHFFTPFIGKEIDRVIKRRKLYRLPLFPVGPQLRPQIFVRQLPSKSVVDAWNKKEIYQYLLSNIAAKMYQKIATSKTSFKDQRYAPDVFNANLLDECFTLAGQYLYQEVFETLALLSCNLWKL